MTHLKIVSMMVMMVMVIILALVLLVIVKKFCSLSVWANNGDSISREYAGTSALKSDFTR